MSGRLATGRRRNAVVGGLFLAASLILAAVVVWHDRAALGRALHRLNASALALSLLGAVAATASTLGLWRSTVTGLGVEVDGRESARVFFVGQLGKYLPGAVWPVVAQIALARRHGISGAVVLAANVLAIALNAALGLLLACVLLPFVNAGALRHFWWLLLCAPALLAALHPRLITALVNRLLRWLGREPTLPPLSGRAEVAAAGWGLASWAFMGLHVYVLVAGLGVSGPRAAAAAVAAGCLAVTAGLLFLPAPAGAGVREVAFVLALAPVLPRTDAVLVAILSRVLFVLADVALAAVGAGLGRRPAGSSG